MAKIVYSLYEKVKNNLKLMAALKNFTHLTEQQILSNLDPGKGPKVTVRDMPNKAGHYDKLHEFIHFGENYTQGPITSEKI